MATARCTIPQSNPAEFINKSINTAHNIHSVLQLFDSVFITILEILFGVDTEGHVTTEWCWNICGADKGILGWGGGKRGI